ncbi:MAG: hypothetical protein HQ481_05660 [Alphaproteobacteria bacterium]|nr:hypothetical protein [Alphaproteobacteria bacterium]
MTKQHKQDGRHDTETISSEPKPAIILDAGKYRSEIAELGLTADQEREYIEVVWAILLQAMQLGIRLEFEPKSCGQDAGTPSPPPIPYGDAVDLKDREFQSNFSDAVGQGDVQAGKETGHG